MGLGHAAVCGCGATNVITVTIAANAPLRATKSCLCHEEEHCHNGDCTAVQDDVPQLANTPACP